MNPQQAQLLLAAQELCNTEPINGETTFQVYLKFCPDVLTDLLNMCVVKPDGMQIQGMTYFDFFLFKPSHDCRSELWCFDELINFGKERFLIHPLMEGESKTHFKMH